MSINQEQEETWKNVESTINDKDESTMNCWRTNCDIKNNMTIEETRFIFKGKRKLLRTGASNIFKNLLDFPRTDEDIVKIKQLPVIQKKSNVARRGKPFRPQARRTRLIDLNLPNNNPETLTELVSEKNFCNDLLKNKNIPNNVKLFIESRMTYVNFKLKRLL